MNHDIRQPPGEVPTLTEVIEEAPSHPEAIVLPLRARTATPPTEVTQTPQDAALDAEPPAADDAAPGVVPVIGPGVEPEVEIEAAREASPSTALDAAPNAAPNVEPDAAPTAAALPVPFPIDEEALVQEVLAELRQQVDRMVEYRLTEALEPLLARAGEALIQDARAELSGTLHDVVRRSVAQVIARYRPR